MPRSPSSKKGNIRTPARGGGTANLTTRKLALSEPNRIEEIRKLGQDGESRQMDRQTHEAGNLARKIIVANFTENIRSVVD
jgi:hypothetical protein